MKDNAEHHSLVRVYPVLVQDTYPTSIIVTGVEVRIVQFHPEQTLTLDSFPITSVTEWWAVLGCLADSEPVRYLQSIEYVRRQIAKDR